MIKDLRKLTIFPKILLRAFIADGIDIVVELDVEGFSLLFHYELEDFSCLYKAVDQNYGVLDGLAAVFGLFGRGSQLVESAAHQLDGFERALKRLEILLLFHIQKAQITQRNSHQRQITFRLRVLPCVLQYVF